MLEGISRIISAQPAVDGIKGVQSQWVGPSTFAYKAEVDFDGTYLASQLPVRVFSPPACLITQSEHP